MNIKTIICAAAVAVASFIGTQSDAQVNVRVRTTSHTRHHRPVRHRVVVRHRPVRRTRVVVRTHPRHRHAVRHRTVRTTVVR